MTIHGSVTGVVNIHTQRTWEKIHTRMQRCARSSCPFASTWHSTHCCASCERSGLHGPHCERLQFGAPDAQRPNDAQKTLPSGSTVQEHFLLGDRSYLLHLPPLAVCAASPPASHVFCFHGAGGRPDHHVNEWEPLVAAGAVVGVYPRGFNGGWALGNVPLQPSEDLEVAAAVKFVEAVLADVEARLPAAFTAPGRPLRFAHGFSNGAGLVQLLACVRPSLFVAASAFATQMREGQRPMGDSRIALLQVSGMADEVIPYEGGVRVWAPSLCAQRTRLASGQTSTAAWHLRPSGAPVGCCTRGRLGCRVGLGWCTLASLMWAMASLQSPAGGTTMSSVPPRPRVDSSGWCGSFFAPPPPREPSPPSPCVRDRCEWLQLLSGT